MEIKRKARTPSPLLISAVVLFSLVTAEPYGGISSPSFYNEIKVGLILDMGSWTGKAVHSCIKMAISDFYGSNNHYTTRLVLHTRDSGGDTMHAISAALDLVENIKVQVIIGLETSLVTKFLAVLGDKANIPIFSFSSILSSSGVHHSLVQIKQHGISQFKGIATIFKSYKWRSVIIIYEDSEDGRQVLPHLVDSLQGANVHTASKAAISPSSTDDQMHDELHKLITLHPTIYIVHMSPSLTSRLFLTAKSLGMMKEGYAWILTDKTMNQFYSMDSEIIESSMQGVLGLKSYIPSSSKLRNVTLRWRKELYEKNDPVMMESSNNIELDVLGIWAYDTLWALGESIERVNAEFLNAAANQNSSDVANPYGGTRLLKDIRRIRFTGLSGEFQILDGGLHLEGLAIVNIIGKGERRVGFWIPEHGLVKKMHPLVKGRSLSLSSTAGRRGLEDVIWPGGSAIPPKGWLMLTRGRKLRILVTSSYGFKELINVYRDAQTNTTSVTGYCVDVFTAVINSLDYQVPYEFIPLDPQNVQNLTRYGDLINLIYRQMFDGIVLDMSITASRSLYVDFTVPYTDLGVGTITKRESNDIWIFSKPLHPSLWFTSAAFFVLTGLVVWAIEHPTNVEFQGSVVHQIGTILWFGFSTLVYAHREKLTSNLSRFVVIVWLFVVLILTSSYTATLSSTLTVRQINQEFVGTQTGSFLGGLVANNTNFKDNRLQLYSSPEDYADALSRGRKKGGVDAIIDEIPYIKIFLGKYGADYAMVASQSTTNGFGFVFQKGSPLVSDMSRAIIKLREEGKLARMERAWFKSQSSFMPEDAAAPPNVLNLERFGGLFLISWLCCILALLIHLIPILLSKLRVMNIIDQLLLHRGILAFLLSRHAPRNGNAIELVNVR